MNAPHTLPWIHPLRLAEKLQADSWALLYSGVRAAYSGQYSFLCVGVEETIAGKDSRKLAASLHHDAHWSEHFRVGWLGYGLKNTLETLPADLASPIATPALMFMRPTTIYRFDHDRNTLECFGEHLLERELQEALAQSPPAYRLQPPAIASLHSNMDKSAYLSHAADILQSIHAGEVYQANLTRKFYGDLKEEYPPFHLFLRLCQTNPAAYSAFIKYHDLALLSSSPEQFLQLDAYGKLTTRPIKGTIARAAGEAADAAAKKTLAESAKDRAENLMIVDLMRNDFSRICIPGSIKVPSLFDITTHPHIHHMSSCVTGRKREGCSALDAALACFPPGSMTGAPKLRAIEICSQMERLARGVYSGALGWFGGDGSMELSVVIRTIILRGNAFEFQVGGGIVADSTPESEWEETLHKAKGIAAALGVEMERLRGV